MSFDGTRTSQPKTTTARRARRSTVAALAGLALGAAALAMPGRAGAAPNNPGPGNAPGHGAGHGKGAPPIDHALPAPPPPASDHPGQPGGYQEPTALTGGSPGNSGNAASPPDAYTFGSDGPDPVLVVYDDGTMPDGTVNQFGYLGQEYAVEAANLASHFGKVTIEPAKSYASGQAASFNAIVYVGDIYNGAVPTTFLNDALSTSHPVLWLGDNVWQLSGNEGSAANTAFQDKYGWDPSSSYFDSSDNEATVNYKGQTFTRNTGAGPVLAPHITNPSGVSVAATTTCSDSTGTTVTCNSIAQSSGSTFPWAIRSANLTYVGEVPLSYISETDRYLVLSDLLFPLLAPSTTPVHNALLRLEDVSWQTDGGASGNIKAEMAWLEANKIPFSVNLIPDFVDPNGVTTGKPINQTLDKNAALVSDLKTAVGSHYGFMNDEGWTHQYSNVNNPYDAVSGDDFEFYRAWCSTTEAWPPPAADPTYPCPNTDYVTEAGPLPSNVDTTAWAQGRINNAFNTIKKAGLPKPNNYIMPHYAGSLTDYKAINPMFRDSYDRKLYFANQLTGAPDYTDYPAYGQFFPYAVTDVNGAVVIPENLGDFEPTMLNEHPPRTVADLTNEAQLNSVLTDGTASFFFNPDQNDPTTGQTPIQVLQALVNNVKALGYTFVSPDDEYNQYKSFLASAQPPNPNPMSVTGLTPNTGPAAGGTAVTVSGSGFTGATTVTWGGQSIPFTVQSGSTLTVTAPAQGSLPATVDVVVSGGGHTSPTTSADQYTYQPAPTQPPPTITSVNPSTVNGSTPTSVVLTGQYFTGATAVDFCGINEPFTVNSDTQITTTSPQTTYQGPCWITVTTPSGTSPQQNNMTFSNYNPSQPAPTVSSVSPSSVSGSSPSTVTLSGQYFTGATTVDFCGIDEPFTVNSDSQITTTSPQTTYVGPCWVTVTTPSGTSAQQNNMTFTS